MRSTYSQAIDEALIAIESGLDEHLAVMVVDEVGRIESVGAGVATVSGLPGVGLEELVRFPNDLYGIAFNLDADEIGVVLLCDSSLVRTGADVFRTGRIMDVPVGEKLLGRVIDPLGNPIDGKGPIGTSARLPIERPAPPIMSRSPVTVPLQTGIKVIDALVPIGRGQRELIMGDRGTGKTSIALSAIANQKDENMVCVFCAIGQKGASIARAIARLEQCGAMDHTVIVAAEGSDSPGLNYIAPYAATSIAEYFVEKGKDVLIVYDDLTHHARTYRELSLLLRRPPGREAFPGDIFYIHSRLLERATHLRPELGGGSLTALPIIETEAQDIAAYIPTNLISITDGQIYLSPDLFELGVLPAVNVGQSVSRVGGKAQRAAYRSVAGSLKLAFSQFEELETFARFGTKLDEHTRQVIAHGQRVRSCLMQRENDLLSVPDQLVVLLALTEGYFDNVPLDQVAAAEQAVRDAVEKLPAEMRTGLVEDKELTDDARAAILKAASDALVPFRSVA